jgi:hypothetical protein
MSPDLQAAVNGVGLDDEELRDRGEAGREAAWKSR